MNAMKAEDIMDVTEAEVAKAMDEAQVQVMIHGHTHRPTYHSVELAEGETGERIVLGDWYEQGSVVRWNADGYSLDTMPR